jgi:hypothetical protein
MKPYQRKIRPVAIPRMRYVIKTKRALETGLLNLLKKCMQGIGYIAKSMIATRRSECDKASL